MTMKWWEKPWAGNPTSASQGKLSDFLQSPSLSSSVSQLLLSQASTTNQLFPLLNSVQVLEKGV